MGSSSPQRGESPLPNHGLRVRVFLDFWNFTLAMKREDPSFQTDYRRLGTVLAHAAIEVVDPTARLDYEGMTIYGSYAEGDRDASLQRWFDIVSGFPGVSLRTTPRRRIPSSITCSRCHRVVDECPDCGTKLGGYKEKGVDVRLATDLIRLAWSDQYDIAVLGSSDGDFVPMAEALDAQKSKIVHAAFPPSGRELSRKCWASFSVPRIRQDFRRETTAPPQA